MEEKLGIAAGLGKEEEVRKILKENPNLKVNWFSPHYYQDHYARTALIWACNNGHDKVVALLLAHPDIDVNQKNVGGGSPFFYACANGKTSCVQLLLKDARVKANQPDKAGHTPLWWIAYQGRLEIIKWTR